MFGLGTIKSLLPPRLKLMAQGMVQHTKVQSHLAIQVHPSTKCSQKGQPGIFLFFSNILAEKL